MALLEVYRPGVSTPEHVHVTRKRPVSVGNHGSVDVAIEAADVPPLLCRIGWNGSDFEATAAGDDDLLINGRTTMQAVMGDGDTLEAGGVLLTMRRGGPGGSAGKGSGASNPVTLDEFEMEEVGEDSAIGGVPASSGDDGATGDGASEQAKEKAKEEVSARNRLRQKLRSQAVRPGERNPLQSRWLQIMAGAIVVLLFTSVVIGLVLRNQSVEAEYDEALAAQGSGNYAEAIRKFEKFIDNHGSHSLVDDARRQLALAEVDALVKAASPVWQDALAGLETYIGRIRDEEDFANLQKEIAQRAGIITLGAARDAGVRRNEDLLGVSLAAQEILKANSSEASPPEALIAEAEAARQKSRRQLQTYDVLDRARETMTAAAEDDRPLDVLRIRRETLVAEPTLARNRDLSELRETALTTLREGVTQTASEVEATPRDFSAWSAVATSTVVERPAGREQQSGGETVVAWVGGSLFGIDTGSGDPLWRVPLGENFEPVEVASPERGWVGADPSRPGLVYLAADGTERSRVALPAQPLRPRANGAGVVVPMQGGRLAVVNLTSGELAATATLPQAILPEPAVVGERLVVFGDRDMVYLLEAGSLAVVELLELGYAPGSMLAAPLSAAKLVVASLNEPRRTRLLVLEVAEDNDSVSLVDEATIAGRVVQTPMLRGRDLFVSSTGGRATVLTLNDEGGGSISRGPTYLGGASLEVPTYLLPGSDRQFWMVGQRLRRLVTAADAIRPVGRSILLGAPMQPPTGSGGQLVVAARPQRDRGVEVSLFDGESFDRGWLMHLGDPLRAVSDQSTGPIAVTGDGFSLRMRADRPFVVDASDKLDGPVQFALTLENGQIAAVGAAERDSAVPQQQARGDRFDRAGEMPVAMMQRSGGGLLTFVATTGRISRRVPLPGVPSVPPRLWRGGLLTAPPGRLKWTSLDGRSPEPPEFWLAQGGDDPPNWLAALPLDDERLLTLDAAGTLRSFAWQASPPAIVESVAATFEGATSMSGRGGLVVVTDGQQLFRVDPATLERTPLGSSLARIDRLFDATPTDVAVAASEGGEASEPVVYAAGVDAASQPLLVAVRGDDVQAVAAVGPVIGVAEEGERVLITTTTALVSVGVDGGDRIEQPLASPPQLPTRRTQRGLVVPLADGTLLQAAGE